MNISLFELFKISSGSSSTHTHAPMAAGLAFVEELTNKDLLHDTNEINIHFFGSLAVAGKAQKADIACLIGLMGISPKTIDISSAQEQIKQIQKNGVLKLNDHRHIRFDFKKNLFFSNNEKIDNYSNALVITAKNHTDKTLLNKTFFSVGGGIIQEKERSKEKINSTLPYPFFSMNELSHLCKTTKKTLAEIVYENEASRLGLDNFDPVFAKLDEFWQIIKSGIKNGVQHHGAIAGGLNITRRAPYLHEKIKRKISQNQVVDNDHWVNLFALAISEENAAGNRIISAPSNGSAGVIAAVLAYYNRFISNDNAEEIRNFFATAAAIGSLFKSSNSTDSLHLGCQGEIGVACSMAAAGLVAVKGGNMEQIEHAAQIAMEHNLGLTCDPLGSLVQIPCIERNCMAAVKAINAARLAMTTGSQILINLDDTIVAMYQAGLRMNDQYKESVLGSASKNLISVNIVYC